MPKVSVDAKGRMSFPSKLREELGDKLVITKTIGAKCVSVYTPADWDSLVMKIKEKPQFQTADIARFLFGDKQTIEPDKQGRFVIAPELRDYAEITADSEAMIIGLEGRAEIWSGANWAEKMKADNIQSNLMDTAVLLGL